MQHIFLASWTLYHIHLCYVGKNSDNFWGISAKAVHHYPCHSGWRSEDSGSHELLFKRRLHLRQTTVLTLANSKQNCLLQIQKKIIKKGTLWSEKCECNMFEQMYKLLLSVYITLGIEIMRSKFEITCLFTNSN